MVLSDFHRTAGTVRRSGVICAALVAALAILEPAGHAADMRTGNAAVSRREAMVKEIMPRVAELRGLDFMRPVPVNVITQADVAKYVSETVDKEMPKEEREGYEKMLVHMGLLDPDAGLKEILVKAYAQQVAGYYDDEKKTFSIVAGSNMPEAMDALTIAHELTHALQDQHYDLAHMRKCAKDNDDLSLALMALAEGDACDIMLRYGTQSYARGKGPVRDFSPFISFSTGSASMPGLPMFLSQNISFPYSYGSRFVVALMKKGGDKAVDEAFRDPPLSTEQIMQPEKYFSRDAPYEIGLADLAVCLGPGWQTLDASPLGQFNLGLFLSNNIGSYGVDEVIAPWKGDILAGYQGPEEDDFVFVYYSTWETPGAAAKFFAAYKRLLENRFQDLRLLREGEGTATWIRGGLIYHLAQRGSDVVSLEDLPFVSAHEAVLYSWYTREEPLESICTSTEASLVSPAKAAP